ncbi:MAG: energy-coupling factor transporter transmembrane protein EcfT [Eubacteriaceae bacterium]|nr:energy-coupling factor transporter transmembrane protein EcfT [Eubacteriaceae bacterium]
MNNFFNYIDRPSPIHKITGAAKLVCLILWTFAAMTSFDTRFLAAVSILGVILFNVSGISFKDVKAVLIFTFGFMAFSAVMLFLFSPEHGVEIYSTRSVICELPGKYALTKEQLFYQLNVLVKYFATVPVVILFVSTTQPSEFAASLNKIGVSYKIAYSVAIALRYIPDIQREFTDISRANQARGIEMESKKISLVKRLKNSAAILFPLIMSSMDRIQIIACAMELRRFGEKSRRSWYHQRPFALPDWAAMALCGVLLAISFLLFKVNGSRYYNPFI